MEELFVEFVCFVQVLLLHGVAHSAMLAVGPGLGKKKLIHYDVVRVDFVGGKFLYKTFRLVQ